MNFYGKDYNVYKANLHTHTKNSDGGYTPEEIIRLYGEHSYDVIAFTDHRKTNKISTYDGKGMTLISGIELHPPGPRNTPWHLLALNVPEDFAGEYASASDAITAVLLAGGIVFCAHPHWSGFTSGDVLTLNGISGIEVYNNSCRGIGRAYNDQCWNELIEAGFVSGALAVDDTHASYHLFGGWTMILAEDKSVPSLMASLAMGRYYATQGPEFHRLELKGRTFEADFTEAVEVIILAEHSRGICVTAPDFPNYGDHKTISTFSVNIPEHYQSPIRCRIRDKEGKYAWSAPIYVN
ncbi:MAG: hypothetical protein IKA79_00975 [Lentisphaeria bacterium]|nr:hypothetical protein [Lentisphaeria bacterium]